MKKIALNILSESISDHELLRKNIGDGFKVDLHFEPVSTRRSILPLVTDLHVNRFSEFLYHFMEVAQDRDIKGNIRILFSAEVINFDHALLAVVALFKKNYHNIDFEITIPFKAAPDVFYRFMSLLLSARQWYFDMYKITLFTIRNEKLRDRERFREPEVILPIIQVNEESFHDLFVKTAYSVDLEDVFVNIEREELQDELMVNLSQTYATGATSSLKNYRALRDTLRNFSDRLSLGNNNRMFLNRYLKLISEFDMLPSQIEALLPNELVDTKLERFRKKGVSETQMQELKRAMKVIVSKLTGQPPMFLLLFSILGNRNLDKVIEDHKLYIEKLNDLYEFSRNLFLGLKEVTRNIVEHTANKTGFICGRIYLGSTILALKNDEGATGTSKMMNTYFRILQDRDKVANGYDDNSFLDITIFDEGRIGIVNKTIQNTRSLTANRKNVDGLYYKDLVALESGKITFPDFYNPAEIKLNHHAIKSSSHWGLIVFTNLINRNNGLFFASSVSDDRLRTYDSCFKSGEHIVSPSREDNHFAMGTFYNIILPLDSVFSLSSDSLINTVPNETNFSEKSFSELLKYSFVKKNSLITADGKDQLLHLPIERIVTKEGSSYRSENVMAQEVSKLLKPIIQQKQKIIPVIDFNGCEDLSDQSKLIRFLAELQNVLEIYSLILVNLPIQTTRVLFSTLAEAFSGDQRELALKSSFWNPGHFILIYSFQQDEDDSRLYSANILGGVNYWDFFILNQKIAATHFTDTIYNTPIQDRLTADTWEGLQSSPLYVASTDVLQNFEMIIEHNGKTLFEHSIEHILNQEITSAG